MVYYFRPKKAYSQLALDKFTSDQCNFSNVGGDITGTYQFLTGFYGLGDMPNEFRRVMDSKLGSIPFKSLHQVCHEFSLSRKSTSTAAQ